MSGFAGFTNYTYRRENTELVLKKMSDSITKRGVDVEAYYDDRYTHMVYRSRAMKNMELKKKAMAFERLDNEYMIVWDGELLNKPELIKSEDIELETSEDEELILKLYDKLGEKFVEKLKGVFAFAIWNKGKQTLFLARDYLGVKPLFYHIQESNFIFASEIKSILQFPDIKAFVTDFGIASMFLNGIVHMKPKPFFKDIQELGAGEYIVYKPNKIRKEKYIGLEIDKVHSPVVRPVDNNIFLTKNEIRNIVKIKDIPSRVLEDVMLVKECEKESNDFEINSLFESERLWNSKYAIRKSILSPHLKIDLDEFHNFQKSRASDEYDLSSIDRISNRFGYNIILPSKAFNIDVSSIRNIFHEILEYIDSPILDLIDRDVTLKIIDEIDIDTISYLIEIDMWLEEYRVQIK